MPRQPPFFVRFSPTRGRIPNIDGIYPQGHVTFLRIQPMALLREQAMTRTIAQDMWGRRLRDYTVVNIGLNTIVLLEDPTLELLNKLIDILADTLFVDPPPDFILGRSHHNTVIRYSNWRILHHDVWIGQLHLAQPRAWELFLAFPLGTRLPEAIEDYFQGFTDQYMLDDVPRTRHP